MDDGDEEISRWNHWFDADMPSDGYAHLTDKRYYVTDKDGDVTRVLDLETRTVSFYPVSVHRGLCCVTRDDRYIISAGLPSTHGVVHVVDTVSGISSTWGDTTWDTTNTVLPFRLAPCGRSEFLVAQGFRVFRIRVSPAPGGEQPALCFSVTEYVGQEGKVHMISHDESTDRIYVVTSPSPDRRADYIIAYWPGRKGAAIIRMFGYRDLPSAVYSVGEDSVCIVSGYYMRFYDIVGHRTPESRAIYADMKAPIAFLPSVDFVISPYDDDVIPIPFHRTGRYKIKKITGRIITSSPLLSVIATPCGTDPGKVSFHRLDLRIPFIVRTGMLDMTAPPCVTEEMCILTLLSDGHCRVHDVPHEESKKWNSSSAMSWADRMVMHNLTWVPSFSSSMHECTSVYESDPAVLACRTESPTEAVLWQEAVAAIEADNARHRTERAKTKEELITRYRFDLLQTILFHARGENIHRGIWVPREIIRVIADYIV